MIHPKPERLQLYVERKIGEWENMALGKHLERCQECRKQVNNVQQLLENLSSMRHEPLGEDATLPPDFAADVTEEVAPSERLAVTPARPSAFIQGLICLIILVTCAALLLVVDTPVTDPSDDVLGAIDVLLGSPFQAESYIVAVLAIMALAGLGVLACVLASAPRSRPHGREAVASHSPRRRR